MRCVTVYAKPFRLDAILDALLPLGPYLLTVEEVRGYGRQKGHLELYSGSEYRITFLPKVRIDAIFPVVRLREVLDAVCTAARTGRIGDGKVLVREVRAWRPLCSPERPA